MACAHQPSSQSPTWYIFGRDGKRLRHGGKPGKVLMYVYVAPPTLVGGRWPWDYGGVLIITRRMLSIFGKQE